MKARKKITLMFVVAMVLVGLYLCIGMNSRNWLYFLSRRGPATIAIIITGAAIAFSTMVFQTITNNRILTPSILGLDSLYMFIQTSVVFVLGSANITIVNNNNANFIISVGFMVVFSLILFKLLLNKETSNVFFLLLIGMIFGTLFQSLSAFMQMLIDPNEFTIVQSRMFASFNNIKSDLLTIVFVVITIVLIFSYKYVKYLDVLSLGKEQAINLGVNYDKVVKRLLIVVAVLVSVSTALVGPITFLGILVVNLAREFLNTYKHRYLILGAILISMIALIGGQLIVTRLLNFKTTLSVIINFVGGIYFIYLLLKEA